MHRRALLKSLAAAALVGCSRQPGAPKPLRVVIAGAGIVGASIAYHLARSGAEVTVIDRQGPATHASRGTFAWINATWAKQPRYYHALSQDSVALWRELQPALPLPIRWGGSLEWFNTEEQQSWLGEQIAEQVEWGEPARMLNAAEVAALEPGLSFAPASAAAYSPNDGAVDPVLATRAFLDGARRLGAKVVYPAELIGTSISDGRLRAIETSAGSMPADRLVLATGANAEAADRFAGIHIPQRSTPGVIALTKPLPRVINRVVSAPGVHLHQRDDGRVILGEQDGAPDNPAHALRLKGRPNDFPSEVLAREHGTRILDVARQFFPGLADADIDRAYIGWRPLPLDGHPVLGVNPDRPDVYIAIMHSGVTLAPVVGERVARELIDEERDVRLDHYRPTRSFQRVERY